MKKIIFLLLSALFIFVSCEEEDNSAQNSENQDYIEIVENIVDEVQMYKSKNIQQIKSLLMTQ